MNRRWAISSVLICLWLVMGPLLCYAQTEADRIAKIKSAFLLNFARFTTWPDHAFDDESSPLVISVVDQPRLLPYLEAIVEGEAVGGRPIAVRVLRYPDGDPTSVEVQERLEAFYDLLRQSHMVFLPWTETERAPELLDRLYGAPVLTVSDAYGFVDAGGMLQLRLRRGRVTFDANVDAIESSSLTVSSKVLKLAYVVKREDR